MKKIFLSLFVACSMLTSCNMDEIEPNTILDTEAINTAKDVEYFRNNLYSSLRALMAGDYITLTELEMDQFVGITGNGNRGMYVNTATVNSSSECVTDDYNGAYSVMKDINFLIEKGNALLASGTLTQADEIAVKRYIGETHFIRGYLYYYLYDHFCQPYTIERADKPALGLSIVTVYNPTGDTSKYPGRSTLNELKQLIYDDMKAAYDALEEFEVTDKTNCRASAPYLSTYAVAAMQARIALSFLDYQTAISKANYVIGATSLFALSTGDAYTKMWTQDTGTELIFVPFVDASESAYIGSFNNAWNYYANWPVRCDYIPTYTTYSAYTDDDIRLTSFFESLEITVSGNQYNVMAFTKFPGNSTLVSGINEYKNKPKPLRLSEQYLILAEASAMDSPAKNESNANTALNTLRRARITDYQDEVSSGASLINAIRDERKKELIGEGFRMSDLRRWNLGFTRDGSYPDVPEVEDIIIVNSASLTFSKDDYRYTWPIPASEMEINPQLKGQQNPGYDN